MADGSVADTTTVRRAFPGVLVLAVSLVAVAARSPAQEAPEDDALRARLADLETQRRLYHAAVAADAAREWAEAATALADMLRLEHLITLPSRPREDPEQLVRGWALRCRRAREKARWERIEKATTPAAARVAPVLSHLDEAVDEVFEAKDLGRAFARLMEGIPEKLRDTQGYQDTYRYGKWLRQCVTRVPFEVRRLPSDARRQINDRWKTSAPTPRKDFLKCAALESLAFARHLGFVRSAEEPDGRSDLKEAEEVRAAVLQLAPARYAGKWVEVEVTVADGPVKTAYPFPLGGVLPVAEFDPGIFLAYTYTDPTRDAMAALVAFGLTPELRRWTRSYPARKLDRIVERLRPGTDMRLGGRVLEHVGGSPSHVFEVWDVDRR